MSTESTTCPGRGALEAFCRGDLPSEVIEGLAVHIKSCTSCASTVEGIPDVAPDSLLSALRRLSDYGGQVDSVAEQDWHTSKGGTGSPPAGLATTQLREYRLLDKLGEGGMGTVYRAVHTRLDRVVALKVLAANRMNDPEAVVRFHREMKAVGKVSHPNIIQATDAGQVAGTHFLVMEFVDGIDLASLVKQHGPLPVAEACELIRQAAQGLQHAHEHGLIHRDIKPSNLMLSRTGQVKVLDLGLARLRDDGATASSATSKNQVLGTCDYMAPEQADNPHAVDGRADLYSLGCTLYHLLTGDPPFGGSEYLTPLQKLKAHGDKTVPPLRQRRAEVPEGVAAAVKMMLAKDPAQRPASAAAVARALEPFTVGSDLRRLAEGRGASGEARSESKGRLPAAQHPRRRLLVPILATLTGLALLVALDCVIVYVQTDSGTLEIATDDKEVKVVVEQDGKLITILDKTTGEKIELKSGVYQLKLGKEASSLRLEPAEFALKRGDRVVAKVRRVPAPPVAKKPEPVPVVQPFQAPAELKPKLVLSRHQDPVSSLVFAPDGRWLASAGHDSLVCLWDTRTFTLHKTIRSPDDRVSCLAFSPDSKVLAGASSLRKQGSVHLWDVATGKEIDLLKSQYGVLDLSFSPDGKWLATGDGDRRVNLWDLKEKKLVRRTEAVPGIYVRRVAFLPDSRTVAAGADHVFVWDSADNKILRQFPHGVLSALSLTSDGKLLAAGHWTNCTITLIPLEGNGASVAWKAHAEHVADVAFSPNGKLLASTGYDGLARLWDVASRRELAVLKGHQGPVNPVAFAPDGKLLATGGNSDRKVMLWDVSAFGQKGAAEK